MSKRTYHETMRRHYFVGIFIHSFVALTVVWVIILQPNLVLLQYVALACNLWLVVRSFREYRRHKQTHLDQIVRSLG